MYIKINEINIYNYLTKLDIKTINKKISSFIDKNIIIKCTNRYLNTLNNLLLIIYNISNNDNDNEILFVINIKNLNDIKIYKKFNIVKYSSFEDLRKNIHVVYNKRNYKRIHYNGKTKSYYDKFNYKYSIYINNYPYIYKEYKKYNNNYKAFILKSNLKIIYNIYYYNYNLYNKKCLVKYNIFYISFVNNIFIINFINNKLFIII